MMQHTGLLQVQIFFCSIKVDDHASKIVIPATFTTFSLYARFWFIRTTLVPCPDPVSRIVTHFDLTLTLVFSHLQFPWARLRSDTHALAFPSFPPPALSSQGHERASYVPPGRKSMLLGKPFQLTSLALVRQWLLLRRKPS